jgi:DNA-binding HxlR family transcriptional regulator
LVYDSQTVFELSHATIRMGGRLDPRHGWSADQCSIAAALEVLATRSAFLILREAFYGAVRFDEFVARVPVSEAVAAARLRELVEHGLLDRPPYREPGQRTRHGYRLTAKGADLFPVLVALLQWGDRWRDDAAPVELRHDGCGAGVAVELRCADGHHVEPADLVLAATPATGALAGETTQPNGGRDGR